MQIRFMTLALTLFAAGCGDVEAPTKERPAPRTLGDDPPVLLPPEHDAGACDASFDPCSPSPCFAGVECTVEDRWIARCGPCPEGTIGDGVECAAPPRLEIHEVDYDQAGADTLEFVELANVGTSAASTAGLALELVNGDGGEIYRRVPLDPLVELAPSSLALVAMSLVSAPGGVPVITTGSSAILQNGPDAVRLVDANGNVLDALAYGGPVVGVAESAHTGAVDDGPGSLGRLEPGGPFVTSCAPTPGLPNAAPCD